MPATKLKYIITALLAATFATASAQEIGYRIESATTAANNDTPPTWHLSNRQGVAGCEAQFSYTRAGIAGAGFNVGNFGIDWGADIIAGDGLTSTIYFQQAFADINWKMFTLSLGQKERLGELKNYRLSTGGLTESGNARPIPQVRIEVPRYYDFFNTGGWFTLRGHLAYGWFTDGEWQKDWVATGKSHTTGVRYHSKAVFFKIGKEERLPLTYEFGLQMVAQFGGTAYNANNTPGEYIHNPSRVKDYLTALIPTKGDKEYTDLDRLNIAGNQLGSWHAALTWDDKKWNARAYYEHVFDDHSQMFLEYGLWTEQLVGVELTLKEGRWVKNIAIEYYNLKNQSGPVYHDTTNEIPDQISCRDDNYNHGIYTGWFNYGLTIGTPLATSPIYNSDRAIICYNNRVEAFHLGIEGEPASCIGYRLLLTHSHNWGTYKAPFTTIKGNTAGLVEFTYKPSQIGGWNFTASYAFDNGTLLGNNRSIMFCISKKGLLNIDKKK